jgi:serine protease
MGLATKRSSFFYYLLLSALLLTPLSSFAQNELKTTILPGKLIIKMDNDDALNELRMKRGVDPINQVQDFLNGFGATQMEAFWSSHKDRQMRELMEKRKLKLDHDPARRLRSVYRVDYHSDIDPEYLAAKISNLPGVDYAEPVYMRFTDAETNDPQAGDYINYQHFPAAWDIDTGSREVVIGIVDSGVFYKHEDLNTEFWINQDEIPASVRTLIDTNNDNDITPEEVLQYLQDYEGDNNGDGVIDWQDGLHPNSDMTTGTDTDGNGDYTNSTTMDDYVDDIYGWDFWDSGNLFQGEQAQTDNDPLGDGSSHGTHVAGISAANTNNGVGIAGTGYNVRYMAVKAGGIPDDPSTPDTDESRSIGFGYQGILYAMMNGADVINNSWGGGGYSNLENDIVNLATEMGALVVSSAGNSNVDGSGYPGAYENVLSVGSVNTGSGIKSSFSNYGYNVGIMATGSGILSSVIGNGTGNSYEAYSGTSMSSPVVSGLAGLIKSHYPNMGPLEIMYQIRGTADPVDNDDYRGKLGSGVINAERALQGAVPGMRIVDFELVNDQGQKIFKGESGQLNIRFTNLGAAANSLSAQLEALSENLTVDETPVSLSAMANGDTAVASFDISLGEDFDVTKFPAFLVNFSDTQTGYQDFRAFEYEELLYDVIEVNGIKTSFAADGSIGFTDPTDSKGGVGFIPRTYNGSSYQELENVLFEGGLMIETNQVIANAVRGSNGVTERDFLPVDNYKLRNPGTVSDVDGTLSFNTSEQPSLNPLTVVNVETYAFDDSGLRDALFVKYTLRNTSDKFLLNNTYVGLFHDWDIGTSSNNNVGYSPQDSILYAYEPNSNMPYIAVAQLGNVAGAMAIDNAYSGTSDSTHFGLYDGFSDQEKRWALRSRTYNTEATSTDISTVVSSGPYNVKPGQEVTVGFVYAHGQNLDDLRAQVASARGMDLFEVSTTGAPQPLNNPIAKKSRLDGNYPNPFNPTTYIQFELASNSETTLEVYNILGQRVATLVDQELTRGLHSIEFDARGLSSGVYIAVLKTNDGMDTRKINLIK